MNFKSILSFIAANGQTAIATLNVLASLAESVDPAEAANIRKAIALVDKYGGQLVGAAQSLQAGKSVTINVAPVVVHVGEATVSSSEVLTITL